MEEGVEGVKFLLRDGVELVIVADGTSGRQTHPSLRRGGSALDGITEDEFSINGAPLTGGDVVAVETGGNQLVLGRAGQEISSQLVDGELIERQVAVEGSDNPVAVGPDLALIVEVQTVCVCVSGHIEPVAAHLFTVLRAVHEAVHATLVGARKRIRQKGVYFGRCGRQAPKVHAQTAQQGRTIGFRPR